MNLDIDIDIDIDNKINEDSFSDQVCLGAAAEYRCTMACRSACFNEPVKGAKLHQVTLSMHCNAMIDYSGWQKRARARARAMVLRRANKLAIRETEPVKATLRS